MAAHVPNGGEAQMPMAASAASGAAGNANNYEECLACQ
jgi:hypothetical protein